MRKRFDDNPVFLARTKNIACLDLAGCTALGATGPRYGAGLPWDRRKSRPYCGCRTCESGVPG